MAGIELPEHLSELNSDEKANVSKPGSSNGDKDDISSIEALNWSDFEEDDLNYEDSKLLQSINSQLSDISQKTEGGVYQRKQSFSSEKATKVLENETRVENETHENSETVNQMITSTHSVASDVNYLDSASNAPVLDDGPIWAKGSKLYKFEENRRFNQKLTFCVLFSVVLAVGLGVGNLAAYNECEAEHKGSTSGNYDEKLNQNIPTTYDEKPDKISRLVDTDPTITSTQFPATKQSDTVKVENIPEAEPTKVNKPMIDPKYALHAEELARVLKMLDELSRKIDRFENTTRQLGGIVMLRDDVIRPDSATKKSKFLGLLDEIMKEKGKKKKQVLKEKTQQELNWRVKKEQILDDIAEAVLGAMDVNQETVHEAESVVTHDETYHNKNLGTENKESLPKISLKETRVEVEQKVGNDSGKREKRHASKRENVSSTSKSTQRTGDKGTSEWSNTTGETGDGKNKKPIYEKDARRHSNQDTQDFKRSEKKTKHHTNNKKYSNPESQEFKRSEKKPKYPKHSKKHSSEDFKESGKKPKYGPGMRTETKDWEAARAKFRQEGRAKSQINWNKKVNNWQAERYNERERLRLRDRRFS